MFNKSGFLTLGKDIFVYKNFVTDEECEILVQKAMSVPEDKWKQNFNDEIKGDKMDCYGMKMKTPYLESF